MITERIIKEHQNAINEFIEEAARKLFESGVPVDRMCVRIRPDGYKIVVCVEEVPNE